ncbi:MAG: hypothetical protein H6506_03355 [Calditrichaeota bacterium]|nr:hypothetical protein [Calditrichota bacterium]MCB9366258.1 hypothetical protein [Calditrichota bacterium]MCB9391673.1 hypothetical protein [Calditrichota bacterium]
MSFSEIEKSLTELFSPAAPSELDLQRAARFIESRGISVLNDFDGVAEIQRHLDVSLLMSGKQHALAKHS